MKSLFSTLVASALIAVTAVSFATGDALAQKKDKDNGSGGGAPTSDKGNDKKSGDTTPTTTSASTDCAAGGVGVLAYAACVTQEGNDTGSGDPLLTALKAGSLFSGFDTSAFEWSILGKSDEGGSGVFAVEKPTGSWSVSSGITGPFVVSLKAGNEYSAYYFNNVTEAINSGTFSTANGKDLSHMTIAAATTPGGGVSQDTPEPFSMIGAGLAIGAGAWMKKRNNKA